MQDIFRLELFHTKDFTVTVGSLILALAVILINIVLIKLISSVIFRRVSKLNITDGRTYAIVQLINIFCG